MKSLSKWLCAGAFAVAPLCAHADQIGVASDVSANVTGTLGAQSGDISTGDGVYHDQTITSDGSGAAQFLFIDETVFNIGPNSNVILDEFIYNPSQGTGEVLLDVTQGAFRFITGSAAPDSYTLRTPTATIGTRGTIFKGIVDSLLTILELIEGKLWVCPREGSSIEGPGTENARRNEDGCILLEDLGIYYVGLDPTGESDGGPGDPDDPDDPNDGIDDIEDPFTPEMDNYYDFECDGECLQER